MKGTVPQGASPAPAQNDSDTPATRASPTKNALSRITLALLDEYSEAHCRGYNPYDSPSGVRKAEPWRRKPKRD
jgi:hypothetical protein